MSSFNDKQDAESLAIGHITEVHGPVVVIACQQPPRINQVLRATIDHVSYLFEVHQHIDQHHIRAITLHQTAGLQRGMPVYDTGAPLHVPVSPDYLGRLLNVFGEPLDDLPPLSTKEYRNVHSRPGLYTMLSAQAASSKLASKSSTCSAPLLRVEKQGSSVVPGLVKPFW